MLNPGLRIYECRLRKGWTQAELAAKACIAQANLSNIEKGKRDLTVSTLVRLAAALGVQPSELIESEESVKPFPLTRAQIETLAAAVINPQAKASREIQNLATLFRTTLPKTGTRASSQKAQQAWSRLRERFSSGEIRGIFQRIEDARQRTYAQKTN